MLLSILFFVCVALNIWLIWFCLSDRLHVVITLLGTDATLARRYFRVPLTEAREKALRQRTLVSMRRLAVLLFYLAAVVLFYSPSMLFSFYRSSLSGAFYSSEALAGMLAGSVLVVWRNRKS